MTMFSPLKHLKGRDLLLNGFSIKGTVTRSYRYGWNKYPQPAVNHIFLLRSRQNLGQGMTFESLMTLTDDSEMRWAEWLGNALVRMSEDLNLKNQTVWRLSLQIQTDWRHSLKNTVLGQRLNPKLLEKPWAGGTLFFRRFRC